LSVLQDHAGHLVQLVGHFPPAARCAARPLARGQSPGRAQEDLQRGDQDPPGRAADDLHRASDRAQGVQPARAGLRGDPRRHDALQGRVAEVVLRRLLATVPVLLLVTAGVFALLHLTPGDPVDAMMAESADASTKESLRRELGLDRPIAEQYAAWMGRLLRGDLGRSIRNGEPVLENVSRRIRPSVQLALLAMAISLTIAFPVAIASAVRHNTGVDRLGTTFALFGICMPNFLLALLLIFVFGVTLRWLPISGYLDPLEEGWSGLRSLILPAVTLGLALAAVITRTLRSSLLEALAEDYVRTARAKGLSEWVVIRGHVLKNALIPVVTVLGLQLGTLIGGAVITEYVFALPGVGRLVVDAVLAPYDPLAQDLGNALARPGRAHWLGTDNVGRDVLSRVIWGTRVSLVAGFVSVAIAAAAGGLLGMLAGYAGGRADGVVMRLMDAVLSFPPLVLALALGAVLGAGLTGVLLALGVVYTPTFARLMRGQVLSVKTRDYVEAARALGASGWWIARRHVLPNAATPIVVQASLSVAFAILAEASLSFLGLGIQPPAASWGSMINAGRG